MSREAMKQALEALESDPLSHAGLVSRKQAITTLRQALETEQEPVAWRFRSGTWFNREVQWRYIDTLDGAEGLRGLQPLYTAPPKREWVSLTAYEIQEIHLGNQHWGNFACAIEAKLREKNQ